VGFKLRSLAPVSSNDPISDSPASEATEIRSQPHVLRFPPPAKLPREALSLLKRQGIVVDLAESGMPHSRAPEVEHESVMRVIQRAPIALDAQELSTVETQPIVIRESSGNASRFGTNKAFLGWLLLGIIAITLAAAIPR
jgi:hypothetical protein